MPNYNYNNYPYGMPYQPFMPQAQQNQNQNFNMQQNQNNQQQMIQPQQQTSYLPLTFVNGIIGAKSFIVTPGQTIYLRDSDDGSNLLFEKSADPYGKYSLKAYRMQEINIDDIGKAPKQDEKLSQYATKQELDSLKEIFEGKLNDLSSMIQKPYKNNKKDSE